MDELDRAIVNRLQGGFPVCPRPFAAVAQELAVDEAQLIRRIERLLAERTLTRFGPMFDMERLGGQFTLCAMSVPAADLARVAALVNAHPQVAHNYEREHRFNLWFVLAVTSAAEKRQIVEIIERQAGYPVIDLPRKAEYFVELKLVA
jgi:siroheme decarboxylase